MNKYQRIKYILWFIFIINLGVAILKIVIGYLSDLTSLMADGLHSIGDGFSNLVGLVGIMFASKPPDRNHPYGHQKFETIASFLIGILLVYVGIQNAYRAIAWFFSPLTPVISFYSLLALIVTLIVNIVIAGYEYKNGKKLKSSILIADSIHTRTDIYISLSVLLSVILIKLGFWVIIDPVLTLIITSFIFHSAYGIFKSTIADLADQKVYEEKVIGDIVFSVDTDIVDVHKIRSRGKEDYIYIDLHLIVPPHKTVEDAHELSHRIEQVLSEKLNKKIELIAHIEPNTRI